MFFDNFDQKQECSILSFVQYIIPSRPSHNYRFVKYICQTIYCIMSYAQNLKLLKIFGPHQPVHTFCKCINPLPDDKILDWSKLKQIADNILKYI